MPKLIFVECLVAKGTFSEIKQLLDFSSSLPCLSVCVNMPVNVLELWINLRVVFPSVLTSWNMSVTLKHPNDVSLECQTLSFWSYFSFHEHTLLSKSSIRFLFWRFLGHEIKTLDIGSLSFDCCDLCNVTEVQTGEIMLKVFLLSAVWCMVSLPHCG